MRAYQPIDASQAEDARSPSKDPACRPKPPQSANDPQPAPETPQVVARIPNLTETAPGAGQERDADLGGAPGRGSRWPLKIMAGGIIVLSAMVLKPMVWPLISGNKNTVSETIEQPPRWPAPPASNAAAPRWDARSDQPAWPPDGVTAGPDRRVMPRSEESPGVSSNPWGTSPGSNLPRTASAGPAWDATARPAADTVVGPRWTGVTGRGADDAGAPGPSWPGQAAAVTAGSATYRTESQGQRSEPGNPYGPTYRTATRPQYGSEPRAASRDDPRDDWSSSPPLGGYPQFTNSGATPDRSTWGNPPRSVPGDGYRDRAPTDTSRRWGPSVGSGDLAPPSYSRSPASSGYQAPPPPTNSPRYGSAPGYQDLAPAGNPSAVQPAWERDVPPAAGYRGYAPAPAGPDAGRPANSPGAAPRWDYLSPGAATRWNYPSTDQTGREPPAPSSSAPSWGPNPGLGDGNPTADPGVARLEGYIEKSNIQTSNERT